MKKTFRIFGILLCIVILSGIFLYMSVQKTQKIETSVFNLQASIQSTVLQRQESAVEMYTEMKRLKTYHKGVLEEAFQSIQQAENLSQLEEANFDLKHAMMIVFEDIQKEDVFSKEANLENKLFNFKKLGEKLEEDCKAYNQANLLYKTKLESIPQKLIGKYLNMTSYPYFYYQEDTE